MAKDIFICHSSTDREAAYVICEAVEAGGIPCWIAPRDVPPGAEWPAMIELALRRAKAIVLLYSETAATSKQVKRELTLAANRELVIFPVRMDSCELTGSFAYYLEDRHWLDATDGGLNRVRALLPGIIHRFISGVDRAPGHTTRGSRRNPRSSRTSTSRASAAHPPVADNTPPASHREPPAGAPPLPAPDAPPPRVRPPETATVVFRRGSPTSARALLIVGSGESAGAMAVLGVADGESVVLGAPDIATTDPSVSRRHAEFFRRDGRYLVRDARSRTGTKVNGKPVSADDAPAELRNGDKINFGNVILHFEIR